MAERGITGRNTVGYTETVDFKCLENLQTTKSMEILDTLSLRYCGREQCAPGQQFGPMTRENYLIHVVLSGKGRFRIGKTIREITGNQAFLIMPGVETSYQADKENPWEYCWFAFRGCKAQTVIEELGFSAANPVIALQDASTINTLVGELLKTREITYANELKRKSLLYAILADMLEQREEDPQDKVPEDPGDRYVKMAVDQIVASYRKKIRVADIADSIGINRSYLTNLFKKKMNMSPQEFLIGLRLEKAAELLRTTEDPVGMIAVNTGYDDSLAFSKAFKQKYGMSPSAYRTETPVVAEFRVRGGYVSASNL